MATRSRKKKVEEKQPEVGEAVVYMALHPGDGGEIELQQWPAVITAVHQTDPERQVVDLQVEMPNDAAAVATQVPHGSEHGCWQRSGRK